MTPESAELAALRAKVDALPQHLSAAVADGIRSVIADEALMKQFSKSLYDELANHTINNTSQWIGRRILTAMVVAITTAGIIWLVKTGALK